MKGIERTNQNILRYSVLICSAWVCWIFWFVVSEWILIFYSTHPWRTVSETFHVSFLLIFMLFVSFYLWCMLTAFEFRQIGQYRYNVFITKGSRDLSLLIFLAVVNPSTESLSCLNYSPLLPIFRFFVCTVHRNKDYPLAFCSVELNYYSNH